MSIFSSIASKLAIVLTAATSLMFASSASAALTTVAAFDQNQSTDGLTISANQATGGVGGGVFASLNDGGNSATDSAVAWSNTDNGVTITVTHNRSERDRDRGVGGFLAAHSQSALYRDFTHFDTFFASGNMTVLLEGLTPNASHQLTWYTYDNSTNASFPFHVYQDSVAAPNVLFSKTATFNGTTDPDITGPNVFTATSDGNGEILMVIGRGATLGTNTAAVGSSTNRSIGYFNGLLVEVEVSPTPEPSTFALTALGVIGLVGMRRRRRN